MFEWTVQTEISKDTCIWSRRSTSLSPGAKFHPGNPRWEVWVRKVVFTWIVFLLNPYIGTSWLLFAPSLALSSFYFLFLARGPTRSHWPICDIQVFPIAHEAGSSAHSPVLGSAIIRSFGKMETTLLCGFWSSVARWNGAMEKLLWGLTRFKATQIGGWAVQCEGHVDKLGRKLGRVLS